MKKIEDLSQRFKEIVKEHKSFVVNYGKGFMSDDDVKEKAYWDDEIKAYRSKTGIWGFELLLEIARGEVENTTIEFLNE